MIKRKIGKYRIKGWLGGGRFADVFLAEDTITGGLFALKVSRERSTIDEDLKKEAKLLLSLEHRNIVRFFSADIIEGRLILAIEYIDGTSLREVIREKSPMMAQEVFPYITQIKEAISYAHKKGILHRDIKPENILITKEGVVKITDFGLAVLLSKETIRSAIAGTPVYMAPETWKGKFTRQSDLWSFAAVVYEMLSGKPPFYGETLEELRKSIKRGNLPKIPRINPEAMNVLKRALNPKPNERYKSVDDFYNSLKNALFLVTPGKRKKRCTKRLPKSLRGLTDEQIEAIKKGDGIVLLLGSSGTGKTTTLAHRIAYLLEMGVQPSSVLALTFAGKALNDLKEKIGRLIPTHTMRELWIETYHSLSMRILSRGVERLGYPEDFTLIDQNQQIDILKTVVKEGGTIKVRSLLKEIEKAKSKLVSPKEYIHSQRDSWHRWVGKIYEKYQNRLKELGYMDFQDLLFNANILLNEYEDIREHFSQLIEYIHVDEFQDINYAQFQLIKTLTSHSGNLFITGDDDQAIYGFRGASSKYFLELKSFFPGLKEFTLSKNFRTPISLIELSQNLITHNRRRREKDVIALKKDTVVDPIKILKAENESEEARIIVSTIATHHAEGIPYEHMAILLRMRSLSEPIEKELNRRGIPYNVTGSSFFESEVIKATIALLEMMLGAIDEERINLVLKKLLRLRVKQVSPLGKKLLQGIKKGGISLPERLGKSKAREVEFLFQCLLQKDQISKESPADLTRELLKKLGYLNYLKAGEKNASYRLELELIEEFIEMAEDFGPEELPLFLNQLTFLREAGFMDYGSSGVFLSTIHSAKGLEFPIVFIPTLVEGVCPLFRALQDPNELEEERRLFYVAITRAQSQLYLTFVKKRHGRFTEPSRFLLELFQKSPEVI